MIESDQMVRPDEESLAVLFALEGAQTGGYTIHSLHMRLPRVLRDQWSERYLTNEVLRPLIKDGFIEAHKEERQVHYEVTAQGKEATAA